MIFFEQLTVTELLQQFSALMEPESSSVHSQKPTTGPYPKPVQTSSPLILPSTTQLPN